VTGKTKPPDDALYKNAKHGETLQKLCALHIFISERITTFRNR